MTENVKTDELEKLENRKQPDAITKPIRPKTKNGMIVSEDEKIKEKPINKSSVTIKFEKI